MFHIYKITNNINQKVYIGQTKRSIEDRFKAHLRKSNRCVKLRRAIEKYGKDNFSIELLTICDSQECANCIETFYIAANDSVKNGYNVSEIGGGTYFSGMKHTAESRKKMSESQKGKIGDKNSFYGKTHSEENKKIISQSRKGRSTCIHTEEHKKNLSKRMLGISNPNSIWTEEQIKNIIEDTRPVKEIAKDMNIPYKKIWYIKNKYGEKK